MMLRNCRCNGTRTMVTLLAFCLLIHSAPSLIAQTEGSGTAGAGASTMPPPDNLPNAPSSSTTSPSLSDLGLSAEQIQGNAREQALLDKRTHMLKIHQRMGLITAGPLIATVISSLGAGGKSTSTSSRDLHVALGSLTG